MVRTPKPSANGAAELGALRHKARPRKGTATALRAVLRGSSQRPGLQDLTMALTGKLFEPEAEAQK